jgi:hypothetical protein
LRVFHPGAQAPLDKTHLAPLDKSPPSRLSGNSQDSPIGVCVCGCEPEREFPNRERVRVPATIPKCSRASENSQIAILLCCDVIHPYQGVFFGFRAVLCERPPKTAILRPNTPEFPNDLTTLCSDVMVIQQAQKREGL